MDIINILLKRVYRILKFFNKYKIINNFILKNRFGKYFSKREILISSSILEKKPVGPTRENNRKKEISAQKSLLNSWY